MEKILNKKINIKQTMIAFILFLGILPAPLFLGLTLPWQYSLLPIFVFVLLFVLFDWIKIPKIAKYLIALWIAIIAEIIFSGVFSPLLLLGKFNFPTESANYIARLLYFATFIVIFYKHKIDLKRFMNTFVVILLFGMGIGVLQFLDWYGSGLFRELYTFSDSHLEVMNRSVGAYKRISGVANFATATGGIAAFTLVLVLSMRLFNKNNFIFTMLGVILTLFNVVTAQARMGYLTVVFSFVIFYFVYNYVRRSGIVWLKSTLLISTVLILTGILTYWLYERGNLFVERAVYRWQALGDVIGSGGNRIAQIERAFSLMDTPWEWLFGISRGVQQSFDSLFIEVEPVSIFILYGGIGFTLIYSLVLFLLVYFWKNIKLVKGDTILLTMVVSSFIGLLCYVFFSGAYWFFREVYVGIFPWIFMGASIGALERYKKNPDKFSSEMMEFERKKKKYKITWK
ncbi:hypothetical protein Pryu01_03066 [Paraliobacillus ryukyuensis]|uniref:O-antigen ligase-like membrane protein n=1 Tax=Paraliobacillus ryukyuensis TaxID=200904 RepID=A0A366DQE2_9BACI|nr:hypothetical protein [Paraliobacillus ryukyuensis]RBO92297.1 hypothetical protein DES48_11535 [Paraliobacillus ryukyuensis]